MARQHIRHGFQIPMAKDVVKRDVIFIQAFKDMRILENLVIQSTIAAVMDFHVLQRLPGAQAARRFHAHAVEGRVNLIEMLDRLG